MSDDITADIAVIGSGVAATAVVTKLLEANPKSSIVMLEAGGKVRMRDFGLFQNFMVTGKLPQDSRTIYDSTYDQTYPERDRSGENTATGDTLIPLNGSRMFAYGGSTGHWGGWAFRMKPEDFELQTRLKNQGIVNPDIIDWPITYDDLEQYYCEAEHYIGVSGDSEDGITRRTLKYPYPAFPFTAEDGLVIKALDAMQGPVTYSHLPIARHGFSDKTTSSHAPCQTTGLCKYCPFGARFAAANYLDDLKSYHDYPNFRILQNHIAERILLDSDSRAEGVEFLVAPNGGRAVLRAGTIIIASGAIEAPKLLMASKGEHVWKNGIGNDSNLVGRYLISHPYFFYRADLPSNEERLQPQMGFPTLVSRHFDSVEEQAKGKFILVHPSSSPVVDLAREMKAGTKVDKIMSKIKGPVRVQLQGIIEVFSQIQNRVSASPDKRNRFGLRQTQVDHNRPVNFDARMGEVKNKVSAIFEKMGATNVIEENPVSWRADHAACTTRMSDDPAGGVVDRNLRVHGMENLYVCSNSSFSSLGAVNPTLTLTALSLRLGDHLNKILHPSPSTDHDS